MPDVRARAGGIQVVPPAQARRIVLAAQGFASPRPTQVTMRHVQREVSRLGQLPIDSVNVVVRAHYAPLFSRLGPYDMALLDRAGGKAPRRVFEYWGHWYTRVQDSHPGLVERVLAEVAASPVPLTARDIEHDEVRRKDHWGWNWSAVKSALEWL